MCQFGWLSCKDYSRPVSSTVISQTLPDFGDDSEARSRIKDSLGDSDRVHLYLARDLAFRQTIYYSESEIYCRNARSPTKIFALIEMHPDDRALSCTKT
ncbi:MULTISPECIES: hypothetical protein [unclassified Microcoleus]|uniref:hypothetical protein n=1 Tax=unclassified Microcoleus TaxID=2642155 RepID=UPI0025CECC0D|nr:MULTISPECIES: hypothetical protein [unclassified Microcoleus]